MGLDLHSPGVEPDERMRDRPCEQGADASGETFTCPSRLRAGSETTDDHVLEVLARASPRPPVHVPAVPLLLEQPRALQDAGIELPPIVDDDHDGCTGPQRPPDVPEARGDAVRIGLERRPRRPCRPGAHLELAAVVEPEQLIGVAVLLVIVDQARIGRRGDHTVEWPAKIELARVAVQHYRLTRMGAHARERLDPFERVQHVAPQERRGLADRTAHAFVLVAPVFLPLRLAREIEVEMSRPPRRPRGPTEHDPQEVRIDVVTDELPKAEQLTRRLRCKPRAHVAARPFARGLTDSIERSP